MRSLPRLRNKFRSMTELPYPQENFGWPIQAFFLLLAEWGCWRTQAIRLPGIPGRRLDLSSAIPKLLMQAGTISAMQIQQPLCRFAAREALDGDFNRLYLVHLLLYIGFMPHGKQVHSFAGHKMRFNVGNQHFNSPSETTAPTSTLDAEKRFPRE
jgi:hypothetical protein